MQRALTCRAKGQHANVVALQQAAQQRRHAARVDVGAAGVGAVDEGKLILILAATREGPGCFVFSVARAARPPVARGAAAGGAEAPAAAMAPQPPSDRFQSAFTHGFGCREPALRIATRFAQASKSCEPPGRQQGRSTGVTRESKALHMSVQVPVLVQIGIGARGRTCPPADPDHAVDGQPGCGSRPRRSCSAPASAPGRHRRRAAAHGPLRRCSPPSSCAARTRQRTRARGGQVQAIPSCRSAGRPPS
jgi:hypothetical protein